MIWMPNFLGNLWEEKSNRSDFFEQYFNDPVSSKSFHWKNFSKYISKIIKGLMFLTASMSVLD